MHSASGLAGKTCKATLCTISNAFNSALTKTAVFPSMCSSTGSGWLLLNSIRPSDETRADFTELCFHFHGTVVSSCDALPDNSGCVTYFCGDFGDVVASVRESLRVIRDFSYNYEDAEDTVELGQVPLNVHNVGILLKKHFHDNMDWFTSVGAAHAFQTLTEGNKMGTSYRKGVYLSQISRLGQDALSFNLLRCSTNLDGPTEGFAAVDVMILRAVNSIGARFFDDAAEVNHVLAQTYENTAQINASGVIKERKARIKGHSDKTKDMPHNGLIAFCSFYSPDIEGKAKRSKSDPCDWVYKDSSVLSTLRFRLKACVTDRPDLVRDFSVTLYPNSIFIIPLLTNRLYTHEIVPPTLPVEHLPTRLGYVARSSNVRAVHRDGHTHLQDGSMLRPPTDAEREHLKGLYYRENTTSEVVEYGKLTYSLNEGDFMQPSLAA